MIPPDNTSWTMPNANASPPPSSKGILETHRDHHDEDDIRRTKFGKKKNLKGSCHNHPQHPHGKWTQHPEQNAPSPPFLSSD